MSVHTGVRLAAYALLATLLLLPLLLHPRGCAFGLHDWSFPCYPEQARNLLSFHLSPWLERNLGQPNPAPQINPLALVIYSIASVAPDFALRSMLWLFLFAAAIGADVFASRLFAASAPVARLAAGLVYMSSPFLATKLVSGHYFFLLDAALVPLGLVALDAIPNGGRRAWCAAALCTSLAFLQLQVGLIMLTLLPLLAWRRIATRHWLGVWCAALLTFLPVAFAGISAYRGGSLSTEVQLAVWLRDESIPWNRVLDATYYFANYYGSAAGTTSVIAWQWLSPACVLVALLMAGTSRRLAFAAIVLGALATGATGPLAPLLVRLFAHIPALSVFRELYDLLALAPLVVAGGAAIAIQYLISRPLGRPVLVASSAGLAAIFGIAMWPALSARCAALVPLSDPRQWQAQVDTAAALPGDDRILWLPTAVPLGPLGSPGGADPFEYPTGRHPSAQSYHASGLFAYAAAQADHAGTLPPALARRLGIGMIVARDRVVSRRLMAAAWPAGGIIAPPAGPAQVIADAGPLAFFAAQPTCEPALRSAMKPDVAYVRCSDGAPLSIPVEDPQTSLDAPNRGWVQGERWAELDAALAEPRWPVLFTRSLVPYKWMTISAGRALIYAPGGARLDNAAIKARAQWRSLPISAGYHTLSGDGSHIIAISATLPISVSISEAKAPALQPSLETQVPAERSDRTWGRYDATLPAHQAGFLILREGYSASWLATIDGSNLGPPVVADGYANGWARPATERPSHLSLRYAPLGAYSVLSGVAALAWLALLGGLFLSTSDLVSRSWSSWPRLKGAARP